jgi:hypothetical protein
MSQRERDRPRDRGRDRGRDRDGEREPRREKRVSSLICLAKMLDEELIHYVGNRSVVKGMIGV